MTGACRSACSRRSGPPGAAVASRSARRTGGCSSRSRRTPRSASCTPSATPASSPGCGGATERLAGVSIHQRLLDAAVVQDLRRRAALVLSWPVESGAEARRLAGWGVHGLISRSFENLAGGAALTGVWSAAETVLARFADVDAKLLAAALLLHVANHGLRSLAWRNVLAAAYPTTRVPILGVASAYAVGVALNAVLPGRGGDAAKVALVRIGIGGVERGHDRLDDVRRGPLRPRRRHAAPARRRRDRPSRSRPSSATLPLIAGGVAAAAVLLVLAGRRLRPALAAAVGRGAAGRRDPAHAGPLRAPRRRRAGRSLDVPDRRRLPADGGLRPARHRVGRRARDGAVRRLDARAAHARAAPEPSR